MMQFLPTTQWFSNVACIPIKLPSPTVQPCTSAAVPYRDVFAKGHAAADVAVQHRVILYIAVFADGQRAVIPAQHRTVPDGGTGL